jgi:hypothetical protein
MPLKPLRTLLEQGYSFEVCTGILRETALLYREPIIFRWYFLLLNKVFREILVNPDFREADTVGPILEVIFESALTGVDAIEIKNAPLVLNSANRLTEAYSAIP